MTYLAFLLIFVALPIVLLVLARPQIASRYPGRRPFLYLLAMAAIAVLYTTPWDNYLVKSGVWSYADNAVLGTIGYVPIEEYVFFMLQPVLTGLVFYLVMLRHDVPPLAESVRIRFVEPAALLLLLAAGIAAVQTVGGRYLGLILVWSVPVLIAQWLFGWKVLRRLRRPAWLSIGLATIYLWVADGFAINTGIWTISDRYTLGLGVLGLPLEEAVFFLVTNIMVVQGLALFLEQTNHRK